ncbi:hypothetical protein ACFRAE_08055 [Sphingobacterium sp. HJSM2_6]|uniref:hypothetical protein n=1 Tax=Sphingobacterium sp. HJSM2_6 TaxID=3366264 RepID=UPI003BC33969
MKKLFNLIVIATSLFSFGCEPIEDRMELGSAITAEQLELSATPLMVNGKRSNKIIVDNKSQVLSSWDYGVGVSQRKSDTVLMVSTGENEIIFTGLNADGSKISKSVKVTIDELTFPVPPEWGFLTNGSERTWKWDETKPAVWGNGGYLGSLGPAWWTLKENDIHGQAANEGVGAKMTLSLRGAKLTKIKADGTTEVGTFSFDMTKKLNMENGDQWSIGKLTTKGVTVLCGKSPNEGNGPVYAYDIIVINGNELVLAYPETGVGAWGTAWFWAFRSTD